MDPLKQIRRTLSKFSHFGLVLWYGVAENGGTALLITASPPQIAGTYAGLDDGLMNLASVAL